jgi:hypothetical protein
MYEDAKREATELFLVLSGMPEDDRNVLIQMLYRASNRPEVYGEQICAAWNRLSNLAQEIRKQEHLRDRRLKRMDRHANSRTSRNDALHEEFDRVVSGL